MHILRFRCSAPLLFLLSLAIAPASLQASDDYQFGFSRVDITPNEPLRLTGYGDRSEPFSGIDERLYVRAMAVETPDSQQSALVSVDTLGLPGALTRSIAVRIREELGIPRSRLVICFTHSHTSPHISNGASNLFALPLSKDEEEGSRRYTDHLAEQIFLVVKQAIADLAPGTLHYGRGSAGFAINRRVLKDGKWVGFGENPAGPVDHSLPVLSVTGDDGRVRGIVFNYACHCTTFDSQHNRINGDWAGYATKYLDERYPGAISLCTIGCGADANPPRERQRATELAQASAHEIADEVQRLLDGPLQPITAPLSTSYGYAGLPVDRPDIGELEKRQTDRQPQVRRHAVNMLAVHARMGRLPETYPAPIQVWRFGDQLTMIFLGGEVVADYAHRLQREAKTSHTWITAYANDLFGYVASERMRLEGGYEVDGSMIYYNQPGPWAKGTEEVLMRRVHELLDTSAADGPYSPAESLEKFHLADGFVMDLVASEPLVEDPVNFAIGADGRLWVAEMSDYPTGVGGSEIPGGRIKYLVDQDGDGHYDKSVLFLDKIPYPTGVMPWRDGVLVTAAPDLIYAADSDGDGQADVRRVLFTGFVRANPQHLINGFSYGLDNWVYLGSGDSSDQITATQTGEVVKVSGRDMRIRPDEGVLETVSGQTQYGRSRDDWGNWFASTNSEPLFHFVISDRYLQRNPFVTSPSPLAHLISPPFAPPVYPTSRTVDRFNDLFAANRFTSACGVTIFRDSTLGPDVQGAALVCESVHNLVTRVMLSPNGVSFRGTRHATEQDSEFLSSTDNWFRPVWLATGPDGALWMADMYRSVIEHPQWIPEAWQAQLDLRAGHDRGRIYRVYHQDRPPRSIPDLTRLTTAELVSRLQQDNGWERDTAQRLLVERGDRSAVAALEAMLHAGESELGRLHALCTLDGLGALSEEMLLTALVDEHPQVQRRAILLSESRLSAENRLGDALAELVTHRDPTVRYQLALSLGYWDHPRAGTLLAQLAMTSPDDPWIHRAVISSAREHAAEVLSDILKRLSQQPALAELVAPLAATTAAGGDDAGVAKVLAAIARSQNDGVQRWQLEALATVITALERRGENLSKLQQSADAARQADFESTQHVFQYARQIVTDDQADIDQQLAAIRLLGHGSDRFDEDLLLLGDLLLPQVAPQLQSAAVSALGELDAKPVVNILLDGWREYPPRLQTEVIEVVLARHNWAMALIDAIEEGAVASVDLDAAARERLLSHNHSSVRFRAEKVLSNLRNETRELVLAEHQDVTSMEGNLFRGADVFDRVCAACHRYRENGKDTGAPLAALKDKSAAALLTAVIDPNRAVEQKYRSYLVTTVDGRVLSGMIESESATSMTLALADGSRASLLRVDIDEMASTGKSLMPEGLERDLTKQELADVIAFVQSQTQPHESRNTSDGSAPQPELAEAEFNGLTQVQSAPDVRPISTWLGQIDMPCTTGQSSSERLRWRTAAVGNDLETARPHVFRLAAAMGADPANHTSYRLELNGRRLLDFQPTSSDASWQSEDGRARLHYLAMRQADTESSGVLFISVPADRLTPGESVELAVTPDSVPGDSWFGLLPVSADTVPVE